MIALSGSLIAKEETPVTPLVMSATLAVDLKRNTLQGLMSGIRSAQYNGTEGTNSLVSKEAWLTAPGLLTAGGDNQNL